MPSVVWNPWHGCQKYSEGCAHCYVYRRDESVGRDASQILRTQSFYDPTARDRKGEYKIKSGTTVYSVMTSDFFLSDADGWRGEVWDMIRERSDLMFFVITKRITRAKECLPDDWGDGWDNFTICSTMENQRRADERLPYLIDFPAKHKNIICEPLLENIDFRDNLTKCKIESLILGGESGPMARTLDYSWVLSIREQCIAAGVPFGFKQTGANFRKDGKVYAIQRKYQHVQAKKAGIDTFSFAKGDFE